MIIRKASWADIDAVEKVYSEVHDAEEAGIFTTGWIRNIYPVRATAEAALQRDDLFVLTVDDDVVGTGIINNIQVDAYEGAPWEFDASDNEVCVLHTMAVTPRANGRGYGPAFVRYYEEYATAHMCRELRIDTNAKNVDARRMYKSAGYREIDIVPTEFNGIHGVDLVLLEKNLGFDPDKTIVSVDQMRRSDAFTIANYVPGRELMYRAAYGVYESYGSWQDKRTAVVVGGGNNGGDGYALAGILKNAGTDPVIYRVSDKMSDDGRYYCGIAEDLSVEILDYNDETDLSSFDVIVDCILGTGFSGEVRGRAGRAIKAINDSGAYVISVDINSGMNGDTGEASLAVRSDLTVSIGYYKHGLFRGKAGAFIGKMTNVDIGIVLVQ